jgi:hypothetical protein
MPSIVCFLNIYHAEVTFVLNQDHDPITLDLPPTAEIFDDFWNVPVVLESLPVSRHSYSVVHIDSNLVNHFF